MGKNAQEETANTSPVPIPEDQAPVAPPPNPPPNDGDAVGEGATILDSNTP